MPPIVLAIGGHDPSGGAGLQADIETLRAHDCAAVTLVTALTAQNTRRVHSVEPTTAAALQSQAWVLLEDVDVAAVKLGLLPTVEVVEAVGGILDALPDVPVVCDPVLRAGSGATLAGPAVAERLLAVLAARITVLTPNSEEARRLGGARDLGAAARALQARGVKHVVVTGTHEDTPRVVNYHYGAEGEVRAYEWPRLADSYHGSGCTLAAAITAEIALGTAISEAIDRAQQYTWSALAGAVRLGKAQCHPWRPYRTLR